MCQLENRFSSLEPSWRVAVSPSPWDIINHHGGAATSPGAPRGRKNSSCRGRCFIKLKKLSASWQLSVQLMYFPMGLGKIMWKWSAMISISISLDPKSRLWKCAAFFLLIDGKQNPTSNHRIPQDWLRNHGTPRDRIYHRASIEPVCNPFTHSNLLPWQRVVPGSLRAQVPSTWEAMTSMQILWVFDGFWFYGIATDDEDQINIQVRYCWWYINMR